MVAKEILPSPALMQMASTERFLANSVAAAWTRHAPSITVPG
jgi:hypothetical protein